MFSLIGSQYSTAQHLLQHCLGWPNLRGAKRCWRGQWPPPAPTRRWYPRALECFWGGRNSMKHPMARGWTIKDNTSISLFLHLCASSKTWVENGTASLSWVDLFKKNFPENFPAFKSSVTVRQKRLPIHHHEKGFWDFRSLDSPFNPSLVLASFGQSSCFSTIMTVKEEPVPTNTCCPKFFLCLPKQAFYFQICFHGWEHGKPMQFC